MTGQSGTWVPILISLLVLVVTAAFNLSTFLDRRAAARLAREKDLHTYVGQIAEIYVVLISGDSAAKQAAIARLGLMIDYGRLYFPNELTPSALAKHQKGLRSRVLDPLVETCSRAQAEDWSVDKIRKDWREFTNELNEQTTAFAVNTSPEADGRPKYRNP